ncbi:MAG: 50S ribosomal protein L11 methyltransferase [Betaproteobacteria bacterium]
MLVEVTLRIDAEHAELLADTLLACGALSVAVEDVDADTPDELPLFGEPGLEPDRLAWQHSRLRVLTEGNEAGARRNVEAAIASLNLAAPVIEACTPVADADWVRATQAQFPPTQVSDRLWIVPTWHDPPDPTAIAVRLDPGVAFGTGTHPTTQLCLAWLDGHVMPGLSVLDYGCGSGILSIAAAKLGAGETFGVDVDDQALEAARANAAANHVTARYTGPDKLHAGSFDIVVANILSNPLKLLAPALLARVAPGGSLVLSGVLERQAEEVIATYRAADPALPLQVWRASEGWVCLAGRRAA